MIILLAVFAALSFFAPSAPVEPPPEPPPVVETVEAVETHVGHAVSVNKLEAAGGLCIFAACGYAGFRLARAGEKQERKRKGIVKTDSAQYALLMRRLDTMARIMESVTDNE